MSAPLPDPHDYDLKALLEAQRAYFRQGSTRKVAFRKERLRGLERLLVQRSDDLLEALHADLGKPALEAYVSEVYFSLAELRLVLKKLTTWAKPKRVGNPFYYWPARSEIRNEPFGNALIVAPWNYPVQLSLSPLIAAVAAGNTVVLKPSEHAPASSAMLTEIITEAFNPQHVAVVEGGPELGKKLLEQSFNYWFYTGSEQVGRLYAEAAAKSLAPVTLELGGKCPVVIADDAPVERSVERIMTTKFFNAGQTCIAPDFVLVPSHRHEAFVKAATAFLKCAYAEEPKENMANIVNDSHYKRLQKLIPVEATRIGDDDDETHFIAPTLIPYSNWECPAMQEEIFGPILPIIPYHDIDEELDRLRRMPSPLALYVFSERQDFLEAVASRIQSGSVCFNDVIKQATNLKLPFGGVGHSGMGRYRGKAGFNTFSYERAITKRWFCKDPFLVKPPYADKLSRLRKLMK
ncbi:MAG: aldehyde dehydrogenase family protein [Verrucomicrobiales bacterium]|nr:aldehyde dehydrogenase family protein [Verrucomicrobiales bacterium]